METSLEEVSEANCVVDPYIHLIYEYSDYIVSRVYIIYIYNSIVYSFACSAMHHMSLTAVSCTWSQLKRAEKRSRDYIAVRSRLFGVNGDVGCYWRNGLRENTNKQIRAEIY